MTQSVTRKYNYSDAILLAHIGKTIERLPTDMSAIEAAIPIINQAFYDQLKADYTVALTEGGDDVLKGKIGQKTQTMVDAMEASKSIVKKIRFWIAEAYPNDPAKRKSFNLKKYWKVAYSQPDLITFMNALATQVEANKQSLQDAGASVEFLDSITTNAQNLAKADAEQEASKGGRANATQARIIAMNSLYERGMKLDRATDIAFEDDTVKADFYNMPQMAPKAEDMEDDQKTE